MVETFLFMFQLMINFLKQQFQLLIINSYVKLKGNRNSIDAWLSREIALKKILLCIAIK